MTPQDFIAKWGAPHGIPGPAYALNEEQGAQSHYLDLCELLDVPKPGSSQGYRFEEKSKVIGGHTGYADVFMPGVFAWENKAPGKNLDTALKQLLTYSLALSNPPILVVSDRLTIRIHTQFTGHPSQTHEVHIADMDQPDRLALLRRIWTAPESFKPKLTNRDITEAAAKSFSTLAEGLRRRGSPQAWTGQRPGAHALRSLKSPPASAPPTPAGESVEAAQQRANQVAHFLTQCLFCFFAEDVGLLPERMFERLLNNRKITCDKLTLALTDLFTAMQNGGMFGADDIPWFNGGLFKTIDLPKLTILDVTELRNAACLNWSAIDVSIFGTLFERGLDPAKRSQLGAHYTDPATILRIVEPVVQRPLLQKWELVAQAIQGLQAKSTKKGDKNHRAAQAQFIAWLDELKNYRVLDPACGSGNFLFLGLKCLKDVEHRSHLEAASLGLDREADLVTGPHNVLGIELNEYAAELARVTVWIGELQWRMAHGYEFKTNPVLEPLDHIECRDALLGWSNVDLDSGVIGSEPGARAAQMPGAHTLRFLKSPPTSAPPTPLSDLGSRTAIAPTGDETTEVKKGSDTDFLQQNSGSDPFLTAAPLVKIAVEAAWPKASVVIGNPPFLGGSKKRRELGDAYFAALDSVFAGRVPGGADLVCYWFEKARQAIESNGLGAAGLVATQSIRAGSNRAVLTAICASTHIFEAWSDESWVNEGAAVRVSLVCFGHADQATMLNGRTVPHITADLGNGGQADLTSACVLAANSGASFEGTKKYGDFDISGQLARSWLSAPNPHGQSNARVVKPWRNGQDLTQRPSDTWIVDFGADMSEINASLFETPFSHVSRLVQPTRLKANLSNNWWLHERPRVAMRQALQALPRYIATTRVSKHRFFVFLHHSVLPDTRLNVIARSDDATFGILNSRIHEVWSLAQASMHGDGHEGGRPTYNAKSCFETYPFPAGLTPADTAHQRTERVEEENGILIPANLELYKQNSPLAHTERAHTATKNIATNQTEVPARPSPQAGMGRRSGAISKSEAYEPPASAPSPPCESQPAQQPAQQTTASQRTTAIAIAKAAKRLNDLRDNWLNPPEWTHKVPEVIPLGMDQSPYPDRIEPKPGITEADLKALQQRTLTKLYNLQPAWLTLAHQQLDAAVASAYGWNDYTPAMPDDDILKRLLALNLQRSAAAS